MEELNVCDFGAKGSGSQEDSAANDAAFRAVLDRLQGHGGRIAVPVGTYHLGQPILLRKLRNVALMGAGGNYVHPGTRLVYIGDDPAGCLHLNTAIHCRIEDICFVSESPVATAVIRIDAIEDGPRAVSSLNNIFRSCTFRSGAKTPANIRGVTLRDAAHSEFHHCWFQTPEIAVSIGAPMQKPAPTISNGQCNNTVFDNCILFGDSVGDRGTNVVFQNCEFAELPNGDGAKIDFGIGTNPHINCVTIRDCFAINGTTHRGTFFTQGKGGAGLVMMNNRIRGYATGVKIDGGGAAMLAGNVFEQTGPTACDIRITCPKDQVTLLANLHAKTVQAGNRPVVYG